MSRLPSELSLKKHKMKQNKSSRIDRNDWCEVSNDNIDTISNIESDIGSHYITQKKTLHSLSIFLFLALIAAGAICGMRIFNKSINNKCDSNIETKIENYLIKIQNSNNIKKKNILTRQNIERLFQNTPEMISVLQASVENQQVPIRFVQKDPFKLHIKHDGNNAILQELSNKEIASKEKLLGELKRLELQSIMDGRVPVAIINGKFYRKGDQIGKFTILTIKNSQQIVELLTEGKIYNLRME